MKQRLLSIKTKMFISLFRRMKAKPLPLLQNSRKLSLIHISLFYSKEIQQDELTVKGLQVIVKESGRLEGFVAARLTSC